jgi:hypothetical protein
MAAAYAKAVLEQIKPREERDKGTHLCRIGNTAGMYSTFVFSLLRTIPTEQEIYRTSNPA